MALAEAQILTSSKFLVFVFRDPWGFHHQNANRSVRDRAPVCKIQPNLFCSFGLDASQPDTHREQT